jgi:uroporphyrinogen decarboxylase
MTSKQRLLEMLNGKQPDSFPFAPAIYEHKAALINRTPADVCRNVDLLCDAVEAEYNKYKPDVLVVGIDIYNIEAEAIGCEINYDNGLGVPTIKTRVLTDSNLKELKIPDPKKDGRMPLIIEATRRINEKFGNEVLVCAGLSGPFSLASSLMGDENLLIASIEDPDYVNEVLKYTTAVIKKYASALLKTGADVMVFDSAAAPPLVSPNQYKANILPNVKDLFSHLSAEGSKFLSYIVGGNTIDSIGFFIEAGAKNIICDFNADLKAFLEIARKHGILLRKNFSPSVLMNGTDDEIKSKASEIMDDGKDYPGLIFGTGILPYDIQPEKVNMLKEIVSTYKK